MSNQHRATRQPVSERPKLYKSTDGYWKIFEIVDGWYHEQTRHHLVDLDPKGAGAMIERIADLLHSTRLSHEAAVKDEAQKELIRWAFQAEAKTGPKFVTEPLAVAYRLVERMKELDPEFATAMEGETNG